MSKYTALAPLTHGVTGAVIQPGESVDLSHLSPAEVEELVSMGAVERRPGKAKRQPDNTEVADGQV